MSGLRSRRVAIRRRAFSQALLRSTGQRRWPSPPHGSTVGLTVDFVAPAQGAELTADATVRRRGRQLCFCDVDVADGHGRLVARGLVTYKLGGTR